MAKVKGCVRFLLIVVFLLSLSMHCASALHAFFSGFAPALTYLSFFADSDCLEIPMPHMSSLLSCIMSDGMLCTFAASHGLLRSLCHMSYNLYSCLAGYTLHPPISSPCSLIVSQRTSFHVGSSVAPAVFWMMLLLFLLCCSLSS